MPWNRYVKNLFPTILQSVWHSCQHPGPPGILSYLCYFYSSTSFDPLYWADRPVPYLLPLPAASSIFWGNAVINWLYSWIEQTSPYNSDNYMKDITLPFQFKISFKNKIPFSNIFPINTGILSTSTFEFSHNICCNI